MKNKYELLILKMEALFEKNKYIDYFKIDEVNYRKRYTDIVEKYNDISGANKNIKVSMEDKQKEINKLCIKLQNLIDEFEIVVLPAAEMDHLAYELEFFLDNGNGNYLNSAIGYAFKLITLLEKNDDNDIALAKVMSIIYKVLLFERTYGRDDLLKFILNRESTLVEKYMSSFLKKDATLDKSEEDVPLNSNRLGIAVKETKFPEYQKLMKEKENNVAYLSNVEGELISAEIEKTGAHEAKGKVNSKIRKIFGRRLAITGACYVLAVALSFGVIKLFSYNMNDLALHRTTYCYEDRVEEKLFEDKTDDYYDIRKVLVYGPWEFGDRSYEIKRTIREFAYKDIDGDVTIDKVENNLILLDSYVEYGIYGQVEDKGPEIVIDEMIKAEGMAEYKEDYTKKVNSSFSVSCGADVILSLVFAFTMFSSDDDFYKYWVKKKNLSKEEKRILEKIRKLNSDKQNYAMKLKELEGYEINETELRKAETNKTLKLTI